jgi:hypothetical protein
MNLSGVTLLPRDTVVDALQNTSFELCKIWGFHSNDYEEWRLLRCYAVWLL